MKALSETLAGEFNALDFYMKHPLTKTQNVLNRMRKAFEKGKGIVIRPDELQEMSLSIFGVLWEEQDPNLTLNEPDLTKQAVKSEELPKKL